VGGALLQLMLLLLLLLLLLLILLRQWSCVLCGKRASSTVYFRRNIVERNISTIEAHLQPPPARGISIRVG
jgi:hypothetical protein